MAKLEGGPIRLGISDLEQRLGVDRATVWRWYTSGDFPPPHYVGTRRAWFLAEVEAWELRRMARRPEERRGARTLGVHALPKEQRGEATP